MPAPDREVAADLGRLDGQIADLLRSLSTERAEAVRACSLNLVIVLRGKEETVDAVSLVASLVERHPARTLLIVPRTEGAGAEREVPPLGAFLSAHCHRGRAGAPVCSEQITLEATEAFLPRLPATILQLLAPELPVYTWWRRPLGGQDTLLGPLAALSDRLIVKGSEAGDPREVLTALMHLASDSSWKGCLGDLTWVRLESWRDLLASFFDSEAAVPQLDRLTRIAVRAGGKATEHGITVAGAYLAGWLTSRLGLTATPSPGVWCRSDGRRVLVELTGDPSLPAGSIARVRLEAPDAPVGTAYVIESISPYRPLVRLTVEVEGTCPLPSIRKLDAHEDLSLLCGELERDAEDPIFEEALRDAARLSDGASAEDLPTRRAP